MMSTYSDLRKAIEQGDLSAVISALDQGADVEEADMHGETGLPLRIACFKGHYTIVSELIRRGAQVHGTGGNGGPMRMAKRGQHHEIMLLLSSHGAEHPLDIKLPEAGNTDRRKRGERRKKPVGLHFVPHERRSAEDRRATFVNEMELSQEQWLSYFSGLPAITRISHDEKFDEEASNILARVRD